MFAVTNIDDMVVLALFFGRAAGSRPAVTRVVIGQYLGFAAILAVSVVGALGMELLSPQLIPYLGLLPLALGVRAGWQVWRDRGATEESLTEPSTRSVGIMQVAAVVLANGGDNIGVYVPVFAVAGASDITAYVVVFLLGVALWCAAGWFFASRRPVVAVISRWGHLLLPVVLIGIGATILISGGAFGL
ncbi:MULTISPECIES: cadmium resistance transporter [unclassified Mycolicibacterium]|uniref:cadmium resistance transporter n=1 Tax=unclassified Mycolicibacterium TaxID=2636767 RepID=UPI0012DD9F28|nr:MULTISPECIES: cadmium resistance transporter [unclassified Mycolicibacterium]MUL84223.1 cadmium transporter [Mycolicibacterium sp. CBMA 329]MUL89711.1 cadmium transporter [Mycolicibacterium sp. CBMA 331]MUL99886.1 cadmium transporter [Mycolicibacterium sp. CBMA 334]MUM27040.1 cadmium transporter [Mycolicibacterium sp. CBMA 295]MUM39226.1 cadmium transporter [Mycolicibacterium sp. CBMA 247]